jgi:hypothetical protein
MSDIATINQAIVDLLVGDTSLGLADVYYGEQAAIPDVPAATVEMGSKERAYNQTGLQTNLLVNIAVVIYHGQVADVQTTKKELDQYVQAVEDKLHEDNTLGGLVISGIVVSVEPGVAVVGRSQFYAHRLIWQGMIKERIGV